jgi:hypothetical protein
MTTAKDEPHGLGDLIMETLAARYRLGEPSWPFKNEHRRAADKLADRGLITIQNDVMPHAFRAALTDAGRAMYIMQSYRVPEVPTW